MGNALSPNQARASAHRRLMRVLALGAALLGSTSHEAAAVIIPPDLIPTPAAVSADLFFNFSPPDPIHVRTFGRHDLSGPGAGSSKTRRSSRAHSSSPLCRVS